MVGSLLAVLCPRQASALGPMENREFGDIHKIFYFLYHLEFFKKGKNSKNRNITIYVAHSQTWASFPCFSEN